MIVLDASVLIAWFDADDAHHPTAETLLAEASDDDLTANPLTLGEVLVAPVRYGRLAEVQAALSDLGVDEVPFPSDTAARLAQLRVSTGLRMPDCCVILAAQGAQATVATFDDPLARGAKALGLAVLSS